MKNKSVAGTLALVMGVFGVHRFYLGQRFLGIMHMLLFFFAMGLTIEEEAPFVLMPALVGFIDAVLLFAMPQEEFDDKYNKRRLRYAQQDWDEAAQSGQRHRQNERPPYYGRPHPNPARGHFNPHKRMGIERFREYDFSGAAIAFEKALEYKFDDPATHFNLACSYSMLEEVDRAFFHLEKAVEFGFADLEKIHRHDALAFLRSLPGFDEFVDHGYQMREALPAPQQEMFENPAQKSDTDNLLEQIIKLGDLREKGILTEQEFNRQKKKLLGE